MIFTLSNGAQLIIPAGALAPTGTTALVVHLRVELADDGGAQPVRFGYWLLALNTSHLSITHFDGEVTLAVPFTAGQLAALGVTPDQVAPSYWDAATWSWKPVPNVNVVTQANGDGTDYIAVDHLTDFALIAVSAQYHLFLPQITD